MTDHHDEPAQSGAESVPEGAPEPGIEVPDDASSITEADAAGPASDVEQQLAERTADLQRLQAEYVNYKRRVDRDRDLARQKGVEQVVTDLLPVLDSIEAARQHESVDGGLKLVIDALEKVAAKHGLVAYGEVGEAFDPHLHEALMQVPLAGDHAATVVSAVMQKGIKLGDRVLRPARVGVADPN